ncbi:TRAP transporter large permease [Xanthobacter agilis]|uniref:TRAP transporter large permease protein n=1 Tax=Xanthobacter agilis TaxID=47492 RepID=A0ABU0LHW7_XANAG|nr:TRAP transporter large permease [Xanthobacter agilis]MDQ0506733.1 tripartite ATP-independent transporter DctM subunit [Xanthobacter agilis]
MTSVLVIGFLFALLAIGTPVGFALAIAGATGLLAIAGTTAVVGVLETTPFSVTNSYELIAIPMFILMAELVVASGIADGLFHAMSVWIGRVRGGLAVATALAGAGFGAISGSSTAAAAALSATSIPAMMRAGYEPRFSCGVVAISGTLAMLIPPSIALVLYGIIAEVSIADLLIGGVIPGLLVTAAIIATVYVLIWRDPALAPAGRSYTWREKAAAVREVGPMLALLLIVTGVIYLGIATPTEAAALGAFGALMLTAALGKLTWPTLVAVLTRAARATCMILMIVIGASIFGFFLTLTQVTQSTVIFVTSLDVSPYVVMALIVAIYIVLGCFMDQLAILILTVPIAVPAIKALGFDPVWFGVIVVVTAEVGMITPPLGLNVFVVSRYSGRPLSEIFSGITPHVIAHIIVIGLLIAFPALVLWLPGTMK